MAQTAPTTSNAASSRAETPWLLPSSRKLRNLISVSLRNLSLIQNTPARARGKTIDDDALPQTLKSPAKLVALREQKALGHSRSSTDLRAVVENAKTSLDEEAMSSPGPTNGSPVASKQKHPPQSASRDSPRRPGFKSTRRRSTNDWANASLQRRQERLEHLARERTADVFFSLHVNGVEEPVYISETINRTMNPTFRKIDWSLCGPGITRLERPTLKVWVRGCKIEDEWRQLLESDMHLADVQHVAKTFDSLERNFPHNAILLHMQDGIYTAYTDSISDYVPQSVASTSRNYATISQPRTLPTSTFDALLRLSKLDDSIQDALAIRNKISSDLERLLEANREALSAVDAVAEAEDRLKTIDYAQKTVQKQLEKAKKQQQEKRDAIAARRCAINAYNESRKAELQQERTIMAQIPDMQIEHGAKSKAISNQQRRICEEMQTCYPIEPLSGKTLAFSIAGLHLPNSENLDSEPPETICAALGHVAHTLQLLAFYLRSTMPYPVTTRGSSSLIYDPISLLKTNTRSRMQASEHTMRTYPLFSKGVPRFHFEYAVFLLNQNIRVLLESAFNLRVLDIRQTLPNLKYLLYVATAGEGELPTRKAGGIRGLMRGSTMQRPGSTDSTSSTLSGLTLHENGKPKGAADRLRELTGKGMNAAKT